MTITTCPNPREIAAYLPAVQPTWFFAVPRIWEKLKAGLEAFLTSGENAERNRAWLEAGTRKVELEQAGRGGPAGARSHGRRGRGEACSPRCGRCSGSTRLVAVNVGAAPTPREVLVFFHAIGIPLAEMWGMSETCGAGACNPPERDQDRHRRPAVAGRRGQAGRRRRAARCARGRDGRLPQPAGADRRGDRRRRLAAHRRRRRRSTTTATSRSSTARRRSSSTRRGKNMSPANIEATLKGVEPADRPGVRDRRRAPLQHGADRARPRLRAGLGGPARARGQDLAALARDERCSPRCRRASTRPTRTLSRVEQIKRFTLVRGDWLPGGDELTPTMKLKRRPIAEKYAETRSKAQCTTG